MPNQVLLLLPEIELIQDKTLQEQVIAVWEEAMAFRDWTVEELESIPNLFMRADMVTEVLTEDGRVRVMTCI